MVIRRIAGGWDRIPIETYKNEPGTWMEVSRQILFPSEKSLFEVRYFELAAGGYTSLEQHEHEHCVIIIEGGGEVFLGGSWNILATGDVVVVRSQMPHQFRNPSEAPFGFICIVDKERDRPVLVENSLLGGASEK